MPKSKKIRAQALAGKQVRHEPLGQTIEGDSNRNKYAAPIRVRRGQVEKHYQNNDEDGGLLDEKTSQKIMEMSKTQQLEMEAEQEREAMFNHERGKTNQQGNNYYDSEEEEEEEIEEIIIDEGEE